VKINLSQKICFKLAFKWVLLFAACFAFFQGCDDCEVKPEPPVETIQDVTGTIRWRLDIDSSLYVVIPDFNPDISYALTGAFLPLDNLPEEYKGEGVRIYFCGEVVEVPAGIQVPAPPLKLTCIIPTYNIIRNARGRIRELNRGPSIIYLAVPDYQPIAPFALNGFPDYLPPDNLPEEFKQDSLRINFSGEIVQLPANIDPIARPLRLTEIEKFE